MYWLMTGDPLRLIVLGMTLLATMAGGWLLARHAFRLEAEERWVAGTGLGLCVFIWSANVLGSVLPVTAGFLGGSLLVLLAGAAFARRSGLPLFDKRDLKAWPAWVWIAAAAVLFTLIGRGLSILDDRKNLSLISLLAAGDIPPHFYMNPEWLFRYHYGFQLFAASLVRLGGLFPWSAFDLSKGFVAALSLAMGYLVGRRLTHRSAGGWAAVAILLFASGARWLLLLVPPGTLRGISDGLTLWGSADTTAAGLDRALVSPWVIAGGPPVPIPFAFVNGILEPFTVGMQAGPGSLSRLILLLLLLLAPRTLGWRSLLPLSILMACWALASEATYALVLAGVLFVGGLSVVLRPRARREGDLPVLVVAGGLSLLASFFQGGTITEVLRSVVAGAGVASTPGAALFSFRWPPAIVSSHLGELPLTRGGSILVALAEIGAAVVASPWVTVRTLRWIRQGRWGSAILGASAVLGFVVPLFVRYHADRDISRFTAHSALVWALLSLPALAAVWRRPGWAGRRASIAGFAILLCLSGIVTLGSLMTAIPRGVISEEIAPLDAGLTRQVWDRLEPGSLVLDSHAWRSVVVTGRWARSTGADDEPLPEWSALLASPDPALIAGAGYAYVYIDSIWWRSMTVEAQASFRAACVQAVAAGEDDADNAMRLLLDVRACRPEG